MAEDKSTQDGLQGLLLLVGISLGLVPSVRVAFGGEVGRLLSWVPGTDGSPGRWLVPMLVIVASVGLIAVLERSKP